MRKCPDCSKKFRKRSTFVRHWKRKHDKRSLEWDAPSKAKKGGK